MQVIKFTITTNASGAYTSALATAPGSDLLDARGPLLLYAVEWVNTDFDVGVDATLTVTATLSGVDLTLLTLTDISGDVMYYPRHVTHGNTGAALTDYAMALVYGTLKLVVAQGGDTKTGACWVYLAEKGDPVL